MRRPFTQVTKLTGRNPVAQAVARTLFAKTVKAFQTRLYMLADGEDATTDVSTAITIFRVFQAASPTPSPVVRGALSALYQAADRGYAWRSSDVVAIDTALTHVREAHPKLDPAAVARAWQQCA